MYLIISLIVCVLTSFLFTLLAKKLRISVVIGLIFAGLIIGSPFFKDIVLEPNTSFILSLGNIGIIFLMFFAGMETSWSMLCKEKLDSIFVAFFAAITPFLLGFIVFYALGFSLLTSVTIAVCMSITAEATTARVLLELKKLKTKMGSLMMGAGIIDDLIGIFLFAIISYFFTRSLSIKEPLLLISTIIAFFSGLFIHKYLGRKTHKIIYLEKILLIFIVPFFFISMGIYFNLHSLALNPLLLIGIVLIAITGKIAGTFLTKPFTKLRWKQLYLIGWAMNSRGAIELPIAFVAFKIGILNTDIYSSLIVMALVTTLIFPFFVRKLVRKNPNIMQ